MYKKTAKIEKSLSLILVILLSLLFGSQTNSGEEILDLIISELDLDNQSFKEEKTSSQSIKLDEIKTSFNHKENITSDIKLSFCPQDDCLTHITQDFDSADESIYCVFYEFDDFNLSDTLIFKSQNEVKVEMIVDDKYLEEEPLKNLEKANIKIYSDKERKTRYNNYMHHKYCIIDNQTLFIGSANPTNNGLYYNNNNLLTIKSNLLSQNFLNEFNQLKKGVFGYNKVNQLKYNNLTLKSVNQTYQISSYMCPQNDCGDILTSELEKAQSEILFATFVLTHNDVEQILIDKNSNGIEVKGIIESRMWNSKGSIAQNLSQIIDLKKDTNSKTMHHKFFLIDNKTLITGSMNPSSSGVNYNDENLLVIENINIISKFRSEFFNLY